MNKFELIYIDLEKKIKEGIYAVGSYLPGEHVLAESYQASRETIRKAQRKLIERGYLQKQRGRGSLVIEHNRYNFPISGIMSYKELQTTQHIPTLTTVLVNEQVPAPDFLIGYDDVVADDLFHHIIRTREIDGQVSIIDEDYIRVDVVSDIPTEIAQDSLYDYFENKLGLVISYANKEIVADKAADLDIAYMRLGQQDYVIKVDSYVHLSNAQFFQYSVSRHQLDKFRFAEFARREN